MSPRGDDKRDQILDAALGLFAERGFHGTAVPLVAERAGVGAGTIYRYFADKDALVNALYQEHKLRMATVLLEAVPHGAPVRQQFRAFWRAWVGFVVENPDAARFLELHHHARYLDATSLAIEARAEGLFVAFIVEAQRQGVVRDVSPELLAAVVKGVFVGFVRAHLDGRLPMGPAEIEAAETCCWEAIRA